VRNVQTSAEDLRVLIGFLRVLSHRSQKKMAAAAGVHFSSLSRFENGLRRPDRADLEKLAKAASVPMWVIDGILMPVIALVRWLRSSPPERLACDAERIVATALGQAHSATTSAAFAEFVTGAQAGDDDEAPHLPTATDPLPLHDPWALLGPSPTAEAALDLDLWRELEGLCVRLCEQSVQAAADDAARALAIARRALLVAELAPGDPALRRRLKGFVWAFIGNALRVGGDLPAAAGCFATAWKLWQDGASAASSSLGEWRLLDLEASLCRGRRRFDAALDRLQQALAMAPAGAKGRILVNKASTLEQAGKYQAALDALCEAAPLVDAGLETRLGIVVRFNRIVLFCHLNRHSQAVSDLADLRRLALEMGNKLDLLRLRWLEGRVAAGLGGPDEARSAFEEVREGFEKRRLAYDTALVSLELAILDLAAGRTAEVRTVAQQMVWIFSAQEVHREALAALALFREAVEAETVTVDLARRVLDYLEQARNDARLRFDHSI
jgi:transcriptional regulator with XRE-family HTH domain/tetratricopeptide (TPR) repeat protein